MRIATNEELLLINGSSQKLSKNQLKKLYDHGGVLTPKDWATMIDNLSQDEVPIIYDNMELYNMMNNHKLIPGKIYYTEYYGEFRDMTNLINGATSIDIIALPAISNSEFGRAYDFNDRTFNIEFYKLAKSIETDENWYEDKGKIRRCDVNVTMDYEESGEIRNGKFKIPALVIYSPTYNETPNIMLYTSLRSIYSTRISPLSEYDTPLFTNECDQFSIEDGMFGLDISINSTIMEESGNSLSLQISTTIEDYFQLDYIIQLNNIIDANNNYFENLDYATLYINELTPVIIDDTKVSGNYIHKCLVNSYYNKVYGNSIIELYNSKNNIIKSIQKQSVFRASYADDNTIIDSVVYHGTWQEIGSDGDEEFQLSRFLNNCIFKECLCRLCLFEGSESYTPDINTSSLMNVNNIVFDKTRNPGRFVNYYNAIRPANSSQIIVTDYTRNTNNDYIVKID